MTQLPLTMLCSDKGSMIHTRVQAKYIVLNGLSYSTVHLFHSLVLRWSMNKGTAPIQVCYPLQALIIDWFILREYKMRSFVLPIFDGVIMDGHPIF